MSALEYSRWSPAGATSLVDLEGQYEDMLSASDFFERFRNDFCSDDYVLLDALATSAVIRYGRCFGPGIRSRLRITQLSDLSAREQVLHELLLATRNKHAAHPVNEQETHAVYVGHSESLGGERKVTSITSGTLVATAISMDLAEESNQLCLRWVDWLDQQRELERQRLLPEAQRLTAAQLLALPRGPTDVSRDPHSVRVQRK